MVLYAARWSSGEPLLISIPNFDPQVLIKYFPSVKVLAETEVTRMNVCCLMIGQILLWMNMGEGKGRCRRKCCRL